MEKDSKFLTTKSLFRAERVLTRFTRIPYLFELLRLTGPRCVGRRRGSCI
jgi:hypothetical protein